MAPGDPTPYDVVPYHSFPYCETHPDQLRVLGRLFGLETPDPERCRVLEIACAGGGNIIPMAERYPDSHFLGVDLAARQIATGLETVAALGLRNLELRHLDLQDLSPADGPFDYIIAHGVYSWVPAPVRAALLDRVAALLSPDGVAMVSHNVKPGWFPRAQAREMMMWHIAGIEDPGERVINARNFLSFMAAATRPEDERHRSVLQAEIEHTSTLPDWLFLHDYLAEVNDGCYLYEMVAELPRRGLRYLGDADMPSMIPYGFADAVIQAIGHLASDLAGQGQVLDFLKNRAFRMTAICRAEREIAPLLHPEGLAGTHLSADAKLGDDGKWHARNGRSFATDHQGGNDLLTRLTAIWPRSLPCAELAGDPELLEWLLLCVGTRLVKLSSAPVVCGDGGDRPRVTPFTRLLSERGPYVTNLRHENVKLGPEQRRLVELLDGSRDLAALRKATFLPVDVLLPELAARSLLAT